MVDNSKRGMNAVPATLFLLVQVLGCCVHRPRPKYVRITMAAGVHLVAAAHRVGKTV